jgi:hypothetical protein
MLIFKADNGYTTQSEEEFEQALLFGYVSEWVAQYYGCRITKMHLGEEIQIGVFGCQRIIFF